MNETWKAVIGFEGRYEVSDQGRVRSIRAGNHKQKRLRGMILKGSVGARGYPVVSLWGGSLGQRKEAYVHRLVLGAFVGPPPGRMDACHTNGNPKDNRLTNLRWGSRSSNIEDTHRHGTHRSAVPKLETVISEMRKRYKQGDSYRSIARYFGVMHGTVKAWITCDT